MVILTKRNLYEELLPYWAAWCQESDTRITASWSEAVAALGLSKEFRNDNPRYVGSRRVCSSCIVQGVMVFTYEAGIEYLKENQNE